MTKRRQTQVRNWKIFRLRGLWGAYGLLDTDLRDRARELVDAQLVRMGAKTEAQHRAAAPEEA